MVDRLGGMVSSEMEDSNSAESHEITVVLKVMLTDAKGLDPKPTPLNPCEGLKEDVSIFDEYVHNYDERMVEEVVADKDIVETSSPIQTRPSSPWINGELVMVKEVGFKVPVNAHWRTDVNNLRLVNECWRVDVRVWNPSY